MREILFRGKRLDNGEWVEGCLITAPDYTCILQDEDKVHPMDYPYLDGEMGTFDGKATPVDPETVCQFTGMTKKNGVKIFEGDIVIDKEGCLYKVFLQEKYYEFSFECIKSDNKFLVNGKWALWSLPRSKDLEVIGNIFDNPELMEGGEADETD